MAGPKHLWSGDWERESDQSPAAQPPTRPEPAAAVEAAPRLTLLQRIGARRLAAGVAAAFVVAGVAVALVVGLNGSSKPAKHRSALARTHAPKPNANNASGGVAITGSSSVPVVYWLGMQILSTPLGAVVTTVPLGSEGDRDGFYPGDVISDVGTADVNSVRQLRAALTSVPIGHSVQIKISRGFGILTETVKLTKRPTDQP